MKTPKQLIRLVACTAGFATLAFATASAQTIVLSDSFSRNVNSPPLTGGPSGWGVNDNAAGGTQTQNYLAQLDTTGDQQQWVNGVEGLLRFGTARISLDIAPLAPLGYTVSFDARRSASGGFVGFVLGLGPADVLTGLSVLNTNADFGFLLKPPSGGQMQLEVLKAGVSQGGNFGAFGDASLYHTVSATVAPNGYAGTADIAITVDGNPAYTGSFPWQVDSNQGYIGFSANQRDASIDNLVITAIPEPMTPALLGLGVLVFLGSRFRRGR